MFLGVNQVVIHPTIKSDKETAIHFQSEKLLKPLNFTGKSDRVHFQALCARRLEMFSIKATDKQAQTVIQTLNHKVVPHQAAGATGAAGAVGAVGAVSHPKTPLHAFYKLFCLARAARLFSLVSHRVLYS